MPTLPEVLIYLQFIRFEAILLGLFITASIILIAQNWRFLILALLLQYVLVGIALSRLVRPDIAVLSVLIGAFICPILFISARQVLISPLAVYDFSGQKDNGDQSGQWWRNVSISTLLMGPDRARLTATGFSFRLFTGLLIILITFSLSNSFPLPNLPSTITTTVYWLILAGLFTIILTSKEPMKVGIGLLTGLTGFSLLYMTIENSLLLTGMWGSVNLLIALAIGYLTVVKGSSIEEER